jgi:hypothetical protein
VTTTENAEDSERPPTNKTDENVNQMQESWSCGHVGNLIWVKLPPGVNPIAVNEYI